MNYKNIIIVDMRDTGQEPEALRQVLESFGCLVMMVPVGRPNDFRKVLQGKIPFDADCIIFSCHGDKGGFLTPELAEEIYEEDEVRGIYSAKEVEQDLLLKDKLIISLGCTTGYEEMCQVFGRDNRYIAPTDYLEGKAAIYFSVKLFYELIRQESPNQDGLLERAFELAKENDDETRLFTLTSC